MIARLIQRLTRDSNAWDCYVEIIAGIPDNH